jgi:hypothetical protein
MSLARNNRSNFLMETGCVSHEVRTTVLINLALESVKVREGEGRGCGNKHTVLGVVPGQEVGGSPQVTPHAFQLSFAVTQLHPGDCIQQELRSPPALGRY